MTHDPFMRGEFPVGVRTTQLHDASRDRSLTAEVWYPAAAQHAGADLDRARRDRYLLAPGYPEVWQAAVRDAAPADGTFPFVVFSHGFAGHRRQSTFFCTHLASHGYAVASVDHAGNTFMDLFGGPTGADIWTSAMAHRPGDVTALIDAAADGRLGIRADTARVGMTGHSFGGWTSLRVIAGEPRIAAVVALAPAIGNPVLRAALDLRWSRPVPVLILAAERDSLLPLAGIEAVHAELAPPATLVTLLGTDHFHFCDAPERIHEFFRQLPVSIVPLATPLAPWAELAPARAGHEAAQGLGVAHLDAALRAGPALAPHAALAARDIAAR